MTITQKYQVFKFFHDSSKEIFEYFETNDPKLKRIHDLYGFSVAPGGRLGGLNHTIVEVFWGNRPYDRAITVQGLNVNTKLQTEQGATLHYHRLDNADIIVSLYPAWTENLKPIEDNIFIDYITNISQRPPAKQVA